MSIWPSKKLRTLTTKIGSGATPRGGGATYVDSGISLIRSQNVLDHEMKLAEIAHITDEAAYKLRGVTVEADDVLINITGDSIARCCIVDMAVLPARVNQHVAILRTTSELDARFLQKFLVAPTFKEHLMGISSGGTRKALTRSDLSNLDIPTPPIEVQRAIAEVLGAFDDKIAANTKLAETSSQLAQSIFAAAATNTEGVKVSLSESSHLLSRGITPKYSEDEGTMIVLNQKCVRDQRVNLTPARRTDLARVREEKNLSKNDVLVNSTGQGTLGRVARWTHDEHVTVDSHITIIRFNPEEVDPVCAGFAVLRSEREITDMAEGSTGQTELSRIELGKLKILLPPREQQQELGQRLSQMAAMENAYLQENERLAATRDALLPQLMSGKLRVKDAETVVEDTL